MFCYLLWVNHPIIHGICNCLRPAALKHHHIISLDHTLSMRKAVESQKVIKVAIFEGDYFRLAAFAFLVIAATATLHLLFLTGGPGSNRLQTGLVTAALCLGHLITFAQLLAVMSQIQEVNWEEPRGERNAFFVDICLMGLCSAPQLSSICRLQAVPLHLCSLMQLHEAKIPRP